MQRALGIVFAIALLCIAVTTWVVAGGAWWQLRQAETLYIKRDYPAAIERLKPAIVRADLSYLPRALRPRKMLAHALIEQGKLDDARIEYQKILSFDDRDHTANFALGMLAWQRGSLGEAEPYLKAAEACNCPNVEFYRNAAIALRNVQPIVRELNRIAAQEDMENKKMIDDMLSDSWLLLIPKIGWVAKGPIVVRTVVKGAWKSVWKWIRPSPEVVALEQQLSAAVKIKDESWKAFLASPL